MWENSMTINRLNESLAGSITISDMRIDENLNLFNELHKQYKIMTGED